MSFEFDEHWSIKERSENPNRQLVVDFLSEQDDKRKVELGLKLLNSDDPYAHTTIWGDAEYTFRKKEKFTYERFTYYLKSGYCNEIYKSALEELYKPKVNSLCTEGVNHWVLLEFLQVYIKPKDLHHIVHYLSRNPIDSFFHFKAFQCLWNVLGGGESEGKEFLLNLFKDSLHRESIMGTVGFGYNPEIDYDSTYHYYTEYKQLTPDYIFSYAIPEVFPLQMEFLRSDKFTVDEKYKAFDKLRFNKCISLKYLILENLEEINSIFKQQGFKEDGGNWNLIEYRLYHEDSTLFEKVVSRDTNDQMMDIVKSTIDSAINCAAIYQNDKFLKFPFAVLTSSDSPWEVRMQACRSLLTANSTIYNYYHADKPELYGKGIEEINLFLEEFKNKYDQNQRDQFLEWANEKIARLPGYELNKNLVHQWLYS